MYTYYLSILINQIKSNDGQAPFPIFSLFFTIISDDISLGHLVFIFIKIINLIDLIFKLTITIFMPDVLLCNRNYLGKVK